MSIKLSAITDLKTTLEFSDGDRIYYIAENTPSIGEYQSQAWEGNQLKKIIGGITQVNLEVAALVGLGTALELVSGSGLSSQYLVIDKLWRRWDSGTAVLEGNTDIEVRSGATNANAIYSEDLLSQATNRANFVALNEGNIELYEKNEGIYLISPSGNPTNGGAADCSLTLNIKWRVIDL